MRHILVILILLGLIPGTVPASDTKIPAATVLRQWVQDMKKAPRGPFIRISWFCKDGSILPPEPYACRTHGGGIQHGEWSDETRILREAGFEIANILAAVDSNALVTTHDGREKLKQILLEQFLIAIDDGWILHRARHYRGALQAEDELAAAQKIIETLLSHPGNTKQEYLLWRDAVRLLPHGQERSLVMQVRQLSTDLAALEPGFDIIRNKIHTLPDEKDAARVRSYLQQHQTSPNRDQYELLATSIDQLYKPTDIAIKLEQLAAQSPPPTIKKRLQQGADVLANHMDPETRFQESSNLLSFLRQNLGQVTTAGKKLALLDASLLLEREAFASGTALLKNLRFASRRERLVWLDIAGNALYGTGQLTRRQWLEIRNGIARLDKNSVSIEQYRAELRSLARVPVWTNRWLQFHYAEAANKFSVIEPKTSRFIPERLRGSSLLVYTVVLDSLATDFNRKLNIQNELFGAPVGLGLRSLNPGIARGTLRIPDNGPIRRNRTDQYSPDDIVLLPETTEKLSRVAGILTLGEGNALSHVQILASNLGIPNVVIDRSLLPVLKSMSGKRVVLAVSPGGRVRLEQDGPQWDSIFKKEVVTENKEIHVDLEKLDLSMRNFIKLGDLRSSDTGRLAGPKAANLGELKYHFPRQVTDGVVIPFGVFRSLLDQKMQTGNITVFEWMRGEYLRLQGIADAQLKQHETRKFLKSLRTWISTADPGEAFKTRLRAILEQVFGKDNTYTVFVRSDTNVEDLPGFTGAGLNLTLPNVRGFEHVLNAISRVWASPFSDRAYAWRQDHMDHPEHVYASVLLMRSVPVEKSGVIITLDLVTGSPQWFTVAVNEGIGGAVAGQQAEELVINIKTGEVRLQAEATSPYRRILGPEGGLQKVPVSNAARLLSKADISKLIDLVKKAKAAFPFQDEKGNAIPADIEFGFQQGRLSLFQIRPFVRNQYASKNLYLNQMDAGLVQHPGMMIDMDQVPEIPAGEK